MSKQTVSYRRLCPVGILCYKITGFLSNGFELTFFGYKKLGALTIWLASRMPVWVSAGLTLHSDLLYLFGAVLHLAVDCRYVSTVASARAVPSWVRCFSSSFIWPSCHRTSPVVKGQKKTTFLMIIIFTVQKTLRVAILFQPLYVFITSYMFVSVSTTTAYELT